MKKVTEAPSEGSSYEEQEYGFRMSRYWSEGGSRFKQKKPFFCAQKGCSWGPVKIRDRQTDTSVFISGAGWKEVTGFVICAISIVCKGS